MSAAPAAPARARPAAAPRVAKATLDKKDMVILPVMTTVIGAESSF
jgi:hypothetical protein